MRDLETHSTGIGDHPALVIVDMCKGFLDPESPIGFECPELIYSNIKLVQKFRERNYPIIFTTTVYRNESDASVFRKKLPGLNILQPDSTEVSFLEELSPSTEDTVIEKKFASAFFETELSDQLAKTNIDSLIISGVTTSGCIRATALDALQHNFLTIVVEDCVGDRNLDAHRAYLFDIQTKYADVIHSSKIFI